jgi:hypothetical protein
MLSFGAFCTTQDGKNGILDKVGIILSPQQFKAIAFMAMNTLQAYEEAYGPLNLKEELSRPALTASDLAAMMIGQLNAASNGRSSTQIDAAPSVEESEEPKLKKPKSRAQIKG